MLLTFGDDIFITLKQGFEMSQLRNETLKQY